MKLTSRGMWVSDSLVYPHKSWFKAFFFSNLPVYKVNHSSMSLVYAQLLHPCCCFRGILCWVKQEGTVGISEGRFHCEKHGLWFLEHAVFQSLPLAGFHYCTLCLQIASLAPLVFMGGDGTRFVSGVILDGSFHLLFAPGTSTQPYL